jgi:hypothetical protein
VKRTNLRWLVVLRSDATSPAVVELSKDEALRTLEAGEAAGAKKALTGGKPQPYYNPHLLGATPEKLEAQRAFFGRLLDSTRCLLFNSGVAGADKLKDIAAAGR